MRKMLLSILVSGFLLTGHQLQAQCSVTISTSTGTTQLNCTNTSITLTANAEGGTPDTYLWSTGETGKSIVVSNPGTYEVTITINNLCNTKSKITITKDVTQPNLSIIAFPEKICAGETATLVALGASTYVWQPPINPATEVVTVSPATTTTYSVTGTALNGCTSTKSYELVVNPLPEAGIAGTTSVCQNANPPSITFTGQKGQMPYTFYYRVNNGPTQTIQTAGQSTAVNLPAPTGVLGPLEYSLLSVSDANGCGQNQTGSATVTVLPGPVLKGEKAASICNNELFTYTAKSSENPTDFSWTRPVVPGISNAAGSGNTKEISETLHNITDQPIVVDYIFSLSTGTGCITNDILKVTVNPSPVVDQVANKSYCNNESVSAGIPFTSSSPGAVFSWANDNSAIGLPSKGNGNIPPFIALNSTNAPITATISVSVKLSPDNCAGLAMMSFTITVLPSPSLAGPKTASICDLAEFNYTASSSVNGTTTFSWTRPAIPEINNPQGSGNSADIKETLHNTSTQPVVVDYIYTLSTAGCTNADILKVTVNPTPAIEPLAKRSYCNGALTDLIQFSSQTPGAVFTWTNSNTIIGLPATGNGSILPFNVTNTGPDPISGIITVSVSANNCAGHDEPFTIEVLPAPVLSSPKTSSVCDSSIFSYKAESLTAGTTFTWTRPAVPGISNVAGSGNSPDISERLDNTKDQPVTVEYIFTLTTPGISCTTTERVRVTVNPTPVLETISPKTYCNGEFVGNGIPFTSPSPAAVFTWTNSNTAIGLPAAGNGSILPFNATNTSPDPISGIITVSVSANNCAGQHKSFSIEVLSGLVLASAKEAGICDSTLFKYKPVSNANNVTVQWLRINDQLISPAPNPNYQALGPLDTIAETLKNASAEPVMVKYAFRLSTGNAGCESFDTLQLTVYPTPKIESITDKKYCNNSVGSVVFNPLSGNSFISWINDSTKIGLPASGNGNIPQFIATNQGIDSIYSNVRVFASVNNGLCKGPERIFKITVFPTPALSSKLDTSVCDGKPFFYLAKSKTPNVSFRWVREVKDSINNPRKAAISTSISDTLDNTSTQPIPVRYEFTLSTGTGINCPSTQTVIVTVNPTPVIIATYDTSRHLIYCNSDSVKGGIAFSTRGNTPNTAFSWTIDKTNIGLAGSGVGSIAPFIITNPTDSIIVATITVKAITSNDRCEGDSLQLKITVNPEPPRPNFTSDSKYPNTDTLKVCGGTKNIPFNINNPRQDVSYRWRIFPYPSNAAWGENQNAHLSNVFIGDSMHVNTVVSFGRDTGLYRVVVYAMYINRGGCLIGQTQRIIIGETVGIAEKKIILKQPGNLLIYPDNTLSKYQWGYDSLLTAPPDSSYGRPVFLPNQVYQFFTPEQKFISGNNLDTRNFLYWVSLENNGCQSRVYYNGPYAAKQSREVTIVQPAVLSVIPNPNQGSFALSLRGNIYGKINANIYNALGQQVFSRQFVKMALDIYEKFDAGKLSSGIYFLEIYSSDLKKVVTRFIIQH